jgi:hypothetical protein
MSSDPPRAIEVQLPEELRREIEARFEAAKAGRGHVLSEDRTAVMVQGSIGYAACISPSGDIFMEVWVNEDKEIVVDRSYQAQLQVLVLGATRLPALSSLLPKRPEGTPACGECDHGWRHPGPIRTICPTCSGLGWISPDPSQGRA